MMIASTMPCSTPIKDDRGAVIGDHELVRAGRGAMSRIPATSTSSIPIRNTTAASTALGRYSNGLVRNSSTIASEAGA